MSGKSASSSNSGSFLWRGLFLAVWFGLVAGLVEAMELIVAQGTNWYRKPPHISGEIIWISPAVDVLLFVLAVLACLATARFVGRMYALRLAVFVCVFLTAFDWLMVFDYLYYISCLLLAAGVSVTFLRWYREHEEEAFQFWKRSVAWVAAVLLFAGTSLQLASWHAERRTLAALPRASEGAPNVLVIVVDTLRADHLSSYGYGRLTSPNIDALAKQGELFENAVSASSWTFPSHVSLLTGRYLYQHGMGNVPRFPLAGLEDPGLGGYPMLSEVLQRHGYRTGAFSANRFFFTGNLGFSRGFVHFEDFFYSPADMFVRTLFGREMASFYWRRGRMRTIVRIMNWFGIQDNSSNYEKEWRGSMANEGMPKRAGTVNHELLTWLDRGSQDHPFFAFANYFDVHMPYGGPPHYSMPGWSQTTRIDHYDDGIRYVDDAVGRLMAELDARGLRRNTIVILTSDHGESLGQHGLSGHADALYWSTVHVPLIISYPPEVPAGAKFEAPVSNASIAATVLDLLGIREPTDFPVSSLRPLWNSAAQPDSPALVWSELAQDPVGGGVADDTPPRGVPTIKTGSMESVVTPRWHYITHSHSPAQLYDWVQDPGEVHDLIHTREGERIAADIQIQMHRDLALRAGLNPEQQLFITGGDRPQEPSSSGESK